MNENEVKTNPAVQGKAESHLVEPSAIGEEVRGQVLLI
jgi:hypothetical protein